MTPEGGGCGPVILNPLNILAASLDETCMLNVAFYEIKKKKSAETAVGPCTPEGCLRAVTVPWGTGPIWKTSGNGPSNFMNMANQV